MAEINDDPFRRAYRTLNEAEQKHVRLLKDYATQIYQGLLPANMPRPDVDQRCMALARTKLEEAVFWAVKGITG